MCPEISDKPSCDSCYSQFHLRTEQDTIKYSRRSEGLHSFIQNSIVNFLY